MKRHLRIVRAGLDRQIATAALRHQLVAVELRQIDKCSRPPGGEAIAIVPVLLEQAGTEPECHSEPRRGQAQRVG